MAGAQHVCWPTHQATGNRAANVAQKQLRQRRPGLPERKATAHRTALPSIAQKPSPGPACRRTHPPAGPLQRLASLDENAVGCTHPCPDHDGGGGGQPEGAGAGDDKHSNAKQEGKQKHVVPLHGK